MQTTLYSRTDVIRAYKTIVCMLDHMPDGAAASFDEIREAVRELIFDEKAAGEKASDAEWSDLGEWINEFCGDVDMPPIL